MIYDIAIIGAGPGGYVSAIRAAQLGAKVALIEKETLGGVCLNWGCIPTKTIITCANKYNEAKKFYKFGVNLENLSFDYGKISNFKQSVVEKIRKSLTGLLKSYNIDIITGEASLESKNKLKIVSRQEYQGIQFKYLILATGSRPVSLPGLPIDHEFIIDTNDMLSLNQLPDSMMIIGSGATGIEWTRILANFDKKVILVECAENFAPMFDNSLSEGIERILKRQRIESYKATKVKNISDKKVILDNGKEFTPDKILLGTGRTPNSDIDGLDELKIAKKNKYIEVDENLRTNIENIYAIGDLTGIFPVAHVAMHQGIKAVENILLNKPVKINYNAVPSIIYGNPEICSVGYSEDTLIARNISYEKSVFPVSAVGRSILEDEIEGFVKVLASKEKILGVHILASHGESMIQQAAIAINSNLSPNDIKETIFAHPTRSEALYEAFLGIDGMPLHLPEV